MGTTYNSTTIQAPVDSVWKLLRDFHGIASWASGIETAEPKGSAKPDQVGAKRLLNDAIAETLVGLNDLDHSFKYTIDAGPGPLEQMSHYVGEATVKPITATGESFVEWTSSWHGNDGAVTEFCNPIYQSLLADLKKAVEA
jgi:hypothetical protein